MRPLLLAAALAALTPAAASADTVLIFWDHPTSYTDGTPMYIDEVQETRLRCVSFTPTGGVAEACPNSVVQIVPGPTADAYFDIGAVPSTGGTYCFQARTVSTAWVFSDWSATACKTFDPVAPKKPRPPKWRNGGVQ